MNASRADEKPRSVEMSAVIIEHILGGALAPLTRTICAGYHIVIGPSRSPRKMGVILYSCGSGTHPSPHSKVIPRGRRHYEAETEDEDTPTGTTVSACLVEFFRLRSLSIAGAQGAALIVFGPRRDGMESIMSL